VAKAIIQESVMRRLLKECIVYPALIVFALLCGCSDSDSDGGQVDKVASDSMPVVEKSTGDQGSRTTPPENEVVNQEDIDAGQPGTGTTSQEAETVSESMDSMVEEPAAAAKTHTINAEARIFKPDIIYINPGDTVGWTNMTSHNTVSVDGLIPEGATPWAGKLGENLQITLDVEGIYAYVCQPHIGFGMVGVIVVGQPDNLDEVKQYATENLKGAYRRIIGKLIKVTIP